MICMEVATPAAIGNATSSFVKRADFRAIAAEYMYLYNMSITARYELQQIPMEEVRRIENNEYAAIKGAHPRAVRDVASV